MTKYLRAMLAALLCTYAALAQPGNADLLLQSPDGKTVKLVWLVKAWTPEMTGFDIKRKDGLDNWVKLNTEPVLPAISARKKLSVVEPDKVEESRVKDKLYDLLKAKKLAEADNTLFLQQLNTDAAKLPEITKLIGQDYDVALMMGFAFVDRSVTRKTDYQYGLFIQGTDKVLATATWNYGEIPDLNVVREITSHATIGKDGIDIYWNADAAKMKAGYVAGFNIYREGIRLNDSPILASGNKEMPEFVWHSRSASSTVQHKYSISAESIFGIEGIIKSYTFDPVDHPKEYRKVDITAVSSLGYYFKEGINIEWAFPKDQERFIKGFVVEKDNMPDGYIQVAALPDASVRTFIDHTSSPVNGYVRVRVSAVYNDKTIARGREKLYSYFPLREPPRPQNLTARGAMEGGKFAVSLNWDAPIAGDSVTESYRLFMWDALNSRFEQVADKLSKKTTSYKYVVPATVDAPVKFCIAGINSTKVESPLSDTVVVAPPFTGQPK